MNESQLARWAAGGFLAVILAIAGWLLWVELTNPVKPAPRSPFHVNP